MLSIAETVIGNDNFTTLKDALISTDLIDTLKDPGPFTLFAPDNEAFTKINPMIMAGLVEDIPSLSKILLFHLVSGKYTLDDLTGLISLSTLEGSDIFITTGRGEIKVNDAIITLADIQCGNGLIHVIDSVIFPSVVEF